MAQGVRCSAGRLVQAAVAVGAAVTVVAVVPMSAAAAVTVPGAVAVPAGMSSRAQLALPATVRLGSVGAGVELAQYELSRVLILSGSQDVDGRFGPRTARAVRDYQQLKALAVDGVVGPRTWTAMLTEHPAPPRLLAGSRGPVVRRLQHLLNIGNPSAAPQLVLDGSYGPATQRAVAGYQRGHGVPASGIVDDRTWVIHIGAANATVASFVAV